MLHWCCMLLTSCPVALFMDWTAFPVLFCLEKGPKGLVGAGVEGKLRSTNYYFGAM